MLEVGLACAAKNVGEFRPSVGRAHVHDPHGLDAGPGWFGAEDARALAALDAAPGVRVTKAAGARPAEPGSAQSRPVAAKVVRRKTAKATREEAMSVAPSVSSVQIAIAFQQTLSRQFGV